MTLDSGQLRPDGRLIKKSVLHPGSPVVLHLKSVSSRDGIEFGLNRLIPEKAVSLTDKLYHASLEVSRKVGPISANYPFFPRISRWEDYFLWKFTVAFRRGFPARTSVCLQQAGRGKVSIRTGKTAPIETKERYLQKRKNCIKMRAYWLFRSIFQEFLKAFFNRKDPEKLAVCTNPPVLEFNFQITIAQRNQIVYNVSVIKAVGGSCLSRLINKTFGGNLLC